MKALPSRPETVEKVGRDPLDVLEYIDNNGLYR